MAVNKKTATNHNSLKKFATPKRIERIESVLKSRISNIRILLENVHNYHNISAVIRSADAFGIQHLHLVGDGFEFSRGITMGSERWISIHQHFDTQEAIKELKKQSFKIVVLQPENFTVDGINYPSIPVYDLPFHERLVLAFGNERDGVSRALAQEADLHAFIPMVGFVDSLNISVAAAITMFCSTISGAKRERHAKPLELDEFSNIHQEWLLTGIRNSEKILKEIERRELE